jgi:linoleoyl-CoA desaturase
MSIPVLQFAKERPEFFSTLSKRVNNYFKTKNIDRTANTEMVLKTIFMFSLYFAPYFLIIGGVTTNLWILFGLCILMGFGKAGIGLSIMHDANHGAYSNKAWINSFLGYSINLVGANSLNWKIQHNVLHHTYTNVHEADEDISPRGVLRLSPESKWRPIHKYQHIYGWLLYGLMTLVWTFTKDFYRIVKYQKEGLIKKQKTTFAKELIILISSKLIYFAYILGAPLLLLDISFGQAVVGFIGMHYLAGFILAIIFQPAHVIQGTEYPAPDDHGTLENNWAIHQMHTTTNFGRKHKAFSWYVGGLNYQVEHHLFPNICHVHYREISKIVEQTAGEFGVPYKSKETFWEAIKAHANQLKMLGEKPVVQEQITAIAA